MMQIYLFSLFMNPTTMKKYVSIIMFCMAGISTLQAQETYLNERMTNTSDVIGTARYVGMGGAMGALGADISVIANNPAGIAMLRKNSLSFTMGPQIQEASPAFGDGRAVFSFDQIGFVAAFSDDDFNLNFAFNYQKRANYNHNLFASQTLGGISQADMFAWVANNITYIKDDDYHFKSPFYDALFKDGFFLDYTPTGSTESYFRNTKRSTQGNFSRHSWGGLEGFDINMSGNYQNRVFVGLTMGIDHIRYRQDASYEELGDCPYIFYQDQSVTGTGFNFKLGTIIRPIEDSPFRFGVTIETPTWFTLKHTANVGLSLTDDAGYYKAPSYLKDDNYLEYNIYSPWKFRASLGSTVSDFLAWDVEYEYSMNDYTKMGYPRESYDSYYGGHGTSIDMDKDVAMGNLTHTMLQGVHNFRAGIELRPFSEVAFRAGYNYYTSPYKSNARLDQAVDSGAFDFTTTTEYINLSDKHIITLGLGYQGKAFFADIAYKYTGQNGEFYAFDDNFTSYNTNFIAENPTLKNVQLKPTKLNYNHHNVALTLGFRF